MRRKSVTVPVTVPGAAVQQADVVLIGGGPAGLSLATALGTAGLSIICIERATQAARAAPRSDGRTVALSHRTRQVLTAAGVWSGIAPHACAIEDIRIADQAATVRLDFDYREVGAAPFGWIIETQLFDLALQRRAGALKNVRMVYGAQLVDLLRDTNGAVAVLADGRRFAAPLIAAADGRRSLCRQLAGIPTYGWAYGQTAMTCLIRHQLPHRQIAVEHFQPGGPFAVLPMTDAPATDGLVYRSSIVWTEKTPAAEALLALDAEAFAARLQAQVAAYLGEIALAGQRFAYPLSLQHARRYTGTRLALIGDAAHSIHPIAGQGFNLAIGDIDCLRDELTRARGLGLDFGDPTILRRYEQQRKRACSDMVLATDLLDRLFSTAQPTVQAARRFGLGAVQHMPFLRRFFMRRAMGLDRHMA